MAEDAFGLSRRGQRLVAKPPTAEYIREDYARSADPWRPETNEDGYVSLCIAENKLVEDLVLAKLADVRGFPPEALGYDEMVGSAVFRQRLSDFLERSLLGRAFPPEQIAVLAGAGSVLEILFHVIADPGDGVLVPTPSYSGFWSDLETRDELTIVPVHTASADGFRLTPEVLQAALDGADRPVKALLFTSPSNPLGRVYSEDEVLEVVEWTGERDLHLVIDEIYGLSVFGSTPFTSVASVLPTLGERVHVVWAFSKDFGASGLRCGVLATENERVYAAVDALAYWACCSGTTQHLLGEMIADDHWVDEFLATLRGRLGAAYERTTAALDAAAIPYVPAEAGIFVLLDLREYLTEPSWEAEDVLWRRILAEANVNLTPGAACRISEPGFMRLCYAAAPTEAVLAGIEHLASVVVRSGVS